MGADTIARGMAAAAFSGGSGGSGGAVDAYTKAETDALLAKKAQSSNVILTRAGISDEFKLNTSGYIFDAGGVSDIPSVIESRCGAFVQERYATNQLVNPSGLSDLRPMYDKWVEGYAGIKLMFSQAAIPTRVTTVVPSVLIGEDATGHFSRFYRFLQFEYEVDGVVYRTVVRVAFADITIDEETGQILSVNEHISSPTYSLWKTTSDRAVSANFSSTRSDSLLADIIFEMPRSNEETGEVYGEEVMSFCGYLRDYFVSILNTVAERYQLHVSDFAASVARLYLSVVYRPDDMMPDTATYIGIDLVRTLLVHDQMMPNVEYVTYGFTYNNVKGVYNVSLDVEVNYEEDSVAFSGITVSKMNVEMEESIAPR